MASAIWYKNIRGVFFGGYKSDITRNYLSPFIFLIHTALLPITLTIGAGIKTLIDYATRKPLQPDKINSSLSKLDRLADQTIHDIHTEKLLQTKKPSSVSNKRLIETMRDIDKQNKIRRDFHINTMPDEKKTGCSISKKISKKNRR